MRFFTPVSSSEMHCVIIQQNGWKPHTFLVVYFIEKFQSL